MESEVKEKYPTSSTALARTVVIRSTLAFLAFGLLIFLPAWTLNYWQAWLYLLVLLMPMTFMVVYLYRHDPTLLERRLRTREKRKEQRLIIRLSWLFFLPAFIIPGFDVRLGWSNVPLAVILLADVIVLLGYIFFSWVLKTNSYASRVIEVEKGQKVISTGPYVLVRHPMYLAVLVIYAFSPLALGSYWAAIPVLLLIPLLVARISDEEKALLAGLEGYREYTKKTRYRLLPGIW